MRNIISWRLSSTCSQKPCILNYEDLLQATQNHKTIVFGGYSGLGYAQEEELAELVRMLVKEPSDHACYVGGGTTMGIGVAYSLFPKFAIEFGYSDIITAGIVTRNAKAEDIAEQDFLVRIDTADGDWRVLQHGRSLLVDLAVDTHGTMIYFGGGAVARSEIQEAVSRGVPVTIVDGPGTNPDPDQVAKALASSPLSIIDGTAGLTGIYRWKHGMDAPMLAK